MDIDHVGSIRITAYSNQRNTDRTSPVATKPYTAPPTSCSGVCFLRT